MSLKEAATALLYTDLGFRKETIPEEVQDYIESRLDAAALRLEKAGIPNPESDVSVMDLWVMYAAYLYRHRNSDKTMPLSLRLALNDAKVSTAVEEET